MMFPDQSGAQQIPFLRTLEIPPEDRLKLENTKQLVETELAELKNHQSDYSAKILFHSTRHLNDILQVALTPVEKTWEKAMDDPNVEFDRSMDGKTLLRITYQEADERLLTESYNLQAELLRFKSRLILKDASKI